MSPRAQGANQGVGISVPQNLKIDPSKQPPNQPGCFIIENVLDIAPDQLHQTRKLARQSDDA